MLPHFSFSIIFVFQQQLNWTRVDSFVQLSSAFSLMIDDDSLQCLNVLLWDVFTHFGTIFGSFVPPYFLKVLIFLIFNFNRNILKLLLQHMWTFMALIQSFLSGKKFFPIFKLLSYEILWNQVWRFWVMG